MSDYEKALSLLTRCNEGFSAFINGRKLSRKDRDKLRADIADFLMRAAPAQPAAPVTQAESDRDPCPGCRKGIVCRTPACGRLKLPDDHPLRAYKSALPVTPKCDGNHASPTCADPECWHK